MQDQYDTHTHGYELPDHLVLWVASCIHIICITAKLRDSLGPHIYLAL